MTEMVRIGHTPSGNDVIGALGGAPSQAKVTHRSSLIMTELTINPSGLAALTGWCLVPLIVYFFTLSEIGWGSDTYRKSMELESASILICFIVALVWLLMWSLDMSHWKDTAPSLLTLKTGVQAAMVIAFGFGGSRRGGGGGGGEVSGGKRLYASCPPTTCRLRADVGQVSLW